MLLYNNVAGKRQHKGTGAKWKSKSHMPGEIGDGILGRIAGGILSSARAVDLDIEVANFFAQRITVDPKKIRRTYLIAAGRG